MMMFYQTLGISSLSGLLFNATQPQVPILEADVLVQPNGQVEEFRIITQRVGSTVYMPLWIHGPYDERFSDEGTTIPIPLDTRTDPRDVFGGIAFQAFRVDHEEPEYYEELEEEPSIEVVGRQHDHQEENFPTELGFPPVIDHEWHCRGREFSGGAIVDLIIHDITFDAPEFPSCALPGNGCDDSDDENSRRVPVTSFAIDYRAFCVSPKPHSREALLSVDTYYAWIRYNSPIPIDTTVLRNRKQECHSFIDKNSGCEPSMGETRVAFDGEVFDPDNSMMLIMRVPDFEYGQRAYGMIETMVQKQDGDELVYYYFAFYPGFGQELTRGQTYHVGVTSSERSSPGMFNRGLDSKRASMAAEGTRANRNNSDVDHLMNPSGMYPSHWAVHGGGPKMDTNFLFCPRGTFTVHELAYDPLSAEVINAAIDFELECASEPRLGTIRYQSLWPEVVVSKEETTGEAAILRDLETIGIWRHMYTTEIFTQVGEDEERITRLDVQVGPYTIILDLS